VSGEFEVDASVAADDIDDVLDMFRRERLVTVNADGP